METYDSSEDNENSNTNKNIHKSQAKSIEQANKIKVERIGRFKYVAIRITIMAILFTVSYIGRLTSAYISGQSAECSMYKLFRLYCPGCGVTRMVKSLMHFEFYKAFRYNVVMIWLLPASIVYITADIVYYIYTGKGFKSTSEVLSIIGYTILAFTILRNIPIFSILQPNG